MLKRLMFLFLAAFAAPVLAVEKYNLEIELIYVDNYAQIPYGYRGVAFIDILGEKCTIIAVKPKGMEDTKHMEILGHELHHCIEGGYHQPMLPLNTYPKW